MKNYQSPEMSIIVIAVEDVITASGVVDDIYYNDNNINAFDIF